LTFQSQTEQMTECNVRFSDALLLFILTKWKLRNVTETT